MTLNQIMVSMGNACTCCRSFHRSGNMKSAVSSSSSGSERVSGSAVTSSAGYELEESKAKTNSRMSCASDDSCAINELLEGRMDLSVTLPNSAKPVVINVERRTPMLDLLVNISTQYRFNAANYTINAENCVFKASTPIGTLDVNQIAIIAKTSKSSSLKSSSPSTVPFQTTFRLQVNLPRSQLMVLRVSPNATIAAIKQIICGEKELDGNKYQLVRFAGKSEGPQLLDSHKTLAYYTINEVTLVSNKDLKQIEMQYGTPSVSDVDLSTSRAASISATGNKKANISVMSRSNPDFTTIDDKPVLTHSPTVKQLKKRPAPPPPGHSSSATLPNRLLSNEMNSSKEDNNETNLKRDSIDKSDQRLTQTIIESGPVLRAPKSVVTHVRQNSGSDSSGYHESVLSSDSPESSSAATVPQTSSTTATTHSTSNNSSTNNKLGAKKRRAPPPPQPNRDSGAQRVNGINDNKHNDNNSIDESKSTAALECMSDVSLPLSTSSSSSGTASSINNRSLSPIVITQTNGSSTPLQTSMNFKQNSLESESVQNPSKSETTISDENPTKFESTRAQPQSPQPPQPQIRTQTPVICVDNDVNNVKSESQQVLTNNGPDPQHSSQAQSDANSVSGADDEVDRQVSIRDVAAQEITVMNGSDANTESSLKSDESQALNANTETSIPVLDSDNTCVESSITAIASESSDPLPKEADVSCIAPALAVSHDNGLYGHEIVEQVVERDISNTILNNSKPGVNHNVINQSPDNQSNDCAIDPTLINSELDLAEMSMPLPPPSPFQNSNHEESNNSLHDCEDEGQGIQHLIHSVPDNEPTIQTEALNDKHISNERMINSFDNNLQTKHQSIDNTIDNTIESTNTNCDTTDANIQSHNTITTNTTTTSPPIVCDEDRLNKEIEVTLQSLNDELDRLDSNDESEGKLLNDCELTVNSNSNSNVEVNYESNRNGMNGMVEHKSNETNSDDSNRKAETNNTTKVLVQVKQSTASIVESDAIKSKQWSAPSPTPRVIPAVSTKSESIVNESREDLKTQFPISNKGKTTVIVNKSQTPSPTPRPLSPPTPCVSPNPPNEDKLSITDEVRQLCRPRVRLTNFSIGSYKKEVDIFEETPKIGRAQAPMTAPIAKSGTKSFVTFPSLKKEEKTRPAINQTKSKVNITATSTTATTTSIPKPSTPVIQTLITSAPKLSRIQSWSGQKSVCLEEKNIKEPVKRSERYVSQISINKDLSNGNSSSSPTQDKQSDEDLRSPQLVVQTLIAKTEERIKNRSPSPKDTAEKAEPTQEHTTISIKPGLESIIHSNSKANNNSENTINKNKNEFNSKQTVPTVPQLISQHLKSKSNLRSRLIESNKTPIEESLQNSVPPPVPPPIPPPAQKTNSSVPPPPIPPPIPQNNNSSIPRPPFPPPVPQNNSSVPPPPPPIAPPIPQTINSLTKNKNSSKSKINTKIFHTKGWNGSNMSRNGEVPKVKHVEPPNSTVDVRDQLLNEIKSFGGKNTLKKVSKNTSWKLEVNNSGKT